MRTKLLSIPKLFVIAAALLCQLITLPAFAQTGPIFTYHGRLVDNVTNTVVSGNVNFIIQIRSTNNCLMYEEVQTKNLVQGTFAINVNSGAGTTTYSQTQSGYSFQQIMSNTTALTFNYGTYVVPVLTPAHPAVPGGACTFTPGPSRTDARRLVVYFFNPADVTMVAWEPLPTQTVGYVPMAVEALNVGGFPADSLLRFVDGFGLPMATTPLSNANYTELMALLTGTSTNYLHATDPAVGFTGALTGDVTGTQGATVVSSLRGTPLSAAAPVAGQYLIYNGASWQPQAGSGGTVTNVSSTNAYLTVTNPTTTPTLTVNVGTVANTVAAGNDARIVGAIQSGAAAGGDLSGTLPNPTVATVGGETAADISTSVTDTQAATAAATAGAIVRRDGTGSATFTTATATNFSGTNYSGRNLYLFNPGLTNRVQVSAAPTLSSDLTLFLPTNNGANGNVLITDGAGNLTWGSATAGSVTTVTASSPVVSSGGFTPNISMPAATNAVHGYLTSNDWTTFNAKLSTALPTGQAWIGSAGGVATPKFLDITDIKSTVAGNWFTVTGTCPVGETWTYSAVNDRVSCAAYTLTTAQVTAALGYTPISNVLSQDNILVGSAGNVATSVAMTGDANIVSTGVITITNNAITTAKINNGAVTNAKITSVDWSKIPNHPTTVAGYGITDAILTNAGGVSDMQAGTLAARPAAAAAPNRFYVATNTGEVYHSNGVAWTLVGSATGLGGTVTAVTAGAPLASSGGTTPNITMPAATTAVDGYLTSVDWTTFNNKQNTLARANGTTDGYLASTDWTIFNNKLSNVSTDVTTALGYIPVNRGGDTMTGALNLPSNGLVVGTTQLVVSGGSVGVGTAAPAASALLDLTSTTKGVLIPRMTSADRTAIAAPATGLQIYNTTTNELNYYNGTSWQALGVTGGAVTTVTASPPMLSSGGTTPNLSMPAATNAVHGYLTSNDWTTFNAKQVAGNYLTDLSGDVTATGPGAVTATISNNAITTAKIANGAVTDAKITSVDWSKVGNTPTTLGGYGITDAISTTLNSARILVGSVGNVATPQLVSGDATMDNTGVLTLANTVTAGTVGSASAVPSITYDAKGRITSTSSNAYQDATGASKGIVQVGNNISVAGGVISVATANGTTTGVLTSADWTTFNNKLTNSLTDGFMWVGNGSNVAEARQISGDATISNVGGLTLATVVSSGTIGSASAVPAITFDAKGRITSVTSSAYQDGTGAAKGILQVGNNLQVAGGVISLQNATNTLTGALTSADWVTFNNKQDAGSYLTGLSGDVTATGPGVAAATIANNAITTAKILNGAVTDAKITSVDWSKVGNTPTTIAGYGIVDAMSTTLNDGFMWVGNGSNVAVPRQVSGDATISNVGGLVLSNVVTAGTVGSASAVPSITYDAKGRITSTSSNAYQDATGAAKGIVQVGNNLQVAAGVISLQNATSTLTGALTSADWVTFNNKQNTLARANGTTDGYLASTDWTIFNNKLSNVSTDVTTALGYIPVNRGGDTMTGALNLPSNGLVVGTTQLVVSGGSVGVGTAAPAASALLDLTSTTKGVLIPRMTSADRTAIAAPATGLQIYNTTTNEINYYNGTSWLALGVAGAGITTLNTLNAVTQNFATGAAGTDFGISSAGSTHTFNIPTANNTNMRGLLTSADWTTFNAKQTAGNYLTDLSGDVTATGPGAVTATISNNAITTAKIANGAVTDAKITSVDWSKVGNTPTTLAGYGITDAASNSLADGNMLIGNGSNVAQARVVSGDATISNVGGLTLSTIVSSGTVGSASAIPSITYDAKGRITATASNAYQDATGATKGIVQIGNNLQVAGGVLSIQNATNTLTGALTSTDWVTFNAKLSNTLADGFMWVGNGSNAAEARQISGDATISNVGGVVLQNTATARTNIGLGTASSPTFTGLTLSSLSTAGFVKNNASGVLSTSVGVDLSSDVTGVLNVANGGTGVNTITAGSLVVGNGTGAVNTLAAGTTGNVIYATGATTWASGTPNTAGLVDRTTAQSISGDKTFTANVIQANGTEVRFPGTTANYVGFRGPTGAVGTNIVWQLPAADGSLNQVLQTNGSGVLSWASQPTVGIVSLDGSSAASQSFATGTTGTDFNISTNVGAGIHTFNIPTANNTNNRGLLTSADWTTFNAKQNAGNYITDLSGDVTAAGPGIATATIANNAITTAKILNGAVTDAKITSVDWSKVGNTPTTIAGYGIVDAMSTTLNDGFMWVGNGSNVAVPRQVSGDATISNVGGLVLSNVVTAGTVGSASAVPSITYDAKGRITSTSSNAYQDATAVGKGIVQIGNNISVSSGTISVATASATTTGVITSSDWVTFNNKQNTLARANGTTDGYLASTDWTIFNNKLSNVSTDVTTALGYIPVNRGGDTMTGALNLPSNGLTVGTSQLVVSGGSVGVGTAAPAASALLDLTSTTKGVLIPRMTSADRTAIAAPATGLQIYNTTTNAINYFDGSVWQALGTAGAGITSINGSSVVAQTFSVGTAGTDFAISTNAGAGTHILNIPSSSGTNRGLLTSTDWTAFNNKMSNALTDGWMYVGNGSNIAEARQISGDATISNVGGLTLATVVSSGTIGSASAVPAITFDAKGRITSVTSSAYQDGTGAAKGILQVGNNLQVAGGVISLQNATNTLTGALTSADWVTFNNKQDAGSYLTGLSGDVTATGPGVAAATIANNAITTAKIANGAVTDAKITSVDWTKVGNRPTTLGGYGITDAISSSLTDGWMLIGNSSNLVQARQVSGDATISNVGGLTLATIVSSGTVGSASAVPTITYDAKGRITGTSSNAYQDATAVGKGIVQVGNNLQVSSGTISLQNATTALTGALTSTDWNTFNNKMSNGLTDGWMWVGNGSNVAEARQISGDATISNVGGVVLQNTATARTNIGLGTGASPTFTGLTLSGLSTAGFVKNSAAGVLSTAASVDLSTETTGTLGVARGGTGATTLTSGSLIVGNGTGAVNTLAAGTTGNVIYATSATAWASGTPNTAGLVDRTTAQSISGDKTFTANMVHANGTEVRFPGSTANYVGFRGPAGAVGTSVVWQLPAADGGVNHVLQTNGAGVLSWVAPSTGTVTSVTANAPVASTGGATPVISMTRSTATVDGWLASTDFTIFNNKMSNTLNDGQMWVGNGSNVAVARTISGDALISNVGGIALQNTATARTNIGLGTGASPTFTGLTLSGLSTAGFVKNNTSGVLSTAASVDLSTEVTGTLAVARGGTGVATATANTLFAGPTGGAAAAPAFRAVVSADISGVGFVQGGNDSFGATAVLGTNSNHSLTVRTNGATRLTLDTSGGSQFSGQAWSAVQTSAAATTLNWDANTGNTMRWTTANTGLTANITNMQPGASYMLVVRGAGTDAVTINCNGGGLPTLFVPANAARVGGTAASKTVYTLLSDGENCLITWITGF